MKLDKVVAGIHNEAGANNTNGSYSIARDNAHAKAAVEVSKRRDVAGDVRNRTFWRWKFREIFI